MIFLYTQKETDYLKKRDKLLGDIIDRLPHIERECDTDLFSAVVHHIIGQQISTKAQATIWARMKEKFGSVTAEKINCASEEELQKLGMTFRKASYIKDFCHKVVTSEFDLEAVEKMSDEGAIKALVSLKGIGVWTAEMILLFCLRRPDILSFDDLAIQRGMRMVYQKTEITKEFFEAKRKELSPYGSVASLYFWAVSRGAISELSDLKVELNVKMESSK